MSNPCAIFSGLISADLAAFASALDRRRSDYETLRVGLTFPLPAGEDVIPACEEFLPESRDKLLGTEDVNIVVRHIELEGIS